MNPVLVELLRTNTAVSEKGNVHRIHSHIPLEEGRFLAEVVAFIKPSTSLEIGLAYGVSTLFIFEGLKDVSNPHHIIADPHQLDPHGSHVGFEGVGLYNLRKAGYERAIEFHAEPSHLALPELVRRGIKVDFAFIDGWHTFDYAANDFFFVDLLLRVGGIVAIDDADFPSVWKLCRYIATNRAYKVFRCLPAQDKTTRHPLRWLKLNGARRAARLLYNLTHSDGLIPHSRCVAFRKESDDTRSWDFHHNF